MAPHSNTLAWKISWTEKPGEQSMGSRRVGHVWATSLSLFTFMHWRRKWQPTPMFLPGESQGQRSLVGCRLWGCTVGHDWSDAAAAAGLNLRNWWNESRLEEGRLVAGARWFRNRIDSYSQVIPSSLSQVLLPLFLLVSLVEKLQAAHPPILPASPSTEYVWSLPEPSVSHSVQRWI